MNKDAIFTHLRPMTTAEMLDRAFAVATRFAPLMWGAGLIYGLWLITTGSSDVPGGNANDTYMAIGILALTLLADYAAAVALLAMFQGLIFPRRPVAAKAICRTAVRKLPGYFLTHLLYILMVIFVGITAWGFFSARQGFPTAVGSVIGAIVALVGFIIAIRLSLAPISCLIEDSSPLPAFARSWHLTSTRPAADGRPADHPPARWFAVAALPVVLIAAVGACTAAYGYFVLGFKIPVQWDNPPATTLLNIFAFAATWLAIPIYWAGLMAMYVEYRMRHEALDFYLRIRELRRQADV